MGYRYSFRSKLAKVIATLGPSSESIQIMEKLVLEGVDGFRINFSHGDPEYWDLLIENIAVVENRLGIHLSIIGDLEGPKIRLGDFEKPIKVFPGDTINISLDRESDLWIESSEFFEIVKPGDKILIDDGKISLRAIDVGEKSIRARVEYGNIIYPRKAVVVSGKDIYIEKPTEKDMESIKYMVGKEFSHIMVSYASSRNHIVNIRNTLREYGVYNIDILAKIETPRGINNIDEILRESDGIVIARGDLGMHFDLDKIPLIQEKLILRSLSYRKPIILATEILSSMVHSTTPLRSEIADIYEGIKSGIDAFLLTSETAIGRNPVQVIRWITKSIETLQRNYKRFKNMQTSEAPEDKLARGIVDLFENLDAELLVYSMSGKFAKRIASYKPVKPFYVGVPSPKVERLIRIIWGSQPITIKANSYQEGLAGLSEFFYKNIVDKTAKKPIIVRASWIKLGNTYEITIHVDENNYSQHSIQDKQDK